MNMNNPPKLNLHNNLYNKRLLMLASLLFVIVLTSSLFADNFVNGDSGVSLGNGVHVKTEAHLKNAINNTPNGGSTLIALDNDIILTETLRIPGNKYITLTSNNVSGHCKQLIGSNGGSTIFVDQNGVLRLDGIIVTHESGKGGSGVTVESGGTLIVYSGEISGNTVYGVGMPFLVGGYGSYGGGVYNSGVFEMYGGKISGNLASVGNGGGVYNSGTFKLSGGEISDNNATTTVFTESETRGNGGGVSNVGIFTMLGGKITDNIAQTSGGGVLNYGTFELSGGTIYDNRPSDVKDYGNGGGTSNGNNGSSVGNDGGGLSDSSGSSADDGGGLSMVEGFSLREVVIICIGVVGVTLAVVMAVLLFVSKVRWSVETEM
ncbi:MAG: hypothetical protein FWD52_06325 [Candidatus Bathyarchaeota archaeon]|nr:hypothetical protein [Candidatus Termiticorpusculum sp.]